MKKRIIFHIPLKLNPNHHSASQIRPIKMLKAFKDLGYEVDVVEGKGNERKECIRKIKKNILNGVHYQFCYSESSTMPTLLTESHHYPTHPFIDFSLLKFCHNRGIKVGLFYRDIYWAFPEKNTNWKSRIAKLFYRYDLKQYRKYVDALFLPSIEMSEYIPSNNLPPIFELPSGAEIKIKENNSKSSDCLELFYVGGIGHHYDLTMIVKVLKDFPNIHLTICCRQEEWASVREGYKPLLSANIDVVHKSGADLDEYYRNSDLCVLFVEPSIYRKFAMPYKLLEFIGRGKPVLASKGTKVAQFVESNNCGITVDYSESALRSALSKLSHEGLKLLGEKVIAITPSHSWEARAEKVAKILNP